MLDYKSRMVQKDQRAGLNFKDSDSDSTLESESESDSSPRPSKTRTLSPSLKFFKDSDSKTSLFRVFFQKRTKIKTIIYKN